jgi:hypothetical protein
MIDKIKRELVSVKFLSLCVSTILFVKGVLSEGGWTMLTLSVIGMKESGKLFSAYKDIQVAKSKKK